MEFTFKLTAVAIYFAAMLGVGFVAFRRTSHKSDYMIGGRRLHPFTASLSAGASDMSGWLLMGLPGALFVSGLVEAWIAVGLVVGTALNWILVAPRLRHYTQIASNSITIPSFLENSLEDRTRLLRISSGLVILVFFTFYVSSGMVAAGLFFESSFGGNYFSGLILVSVITVMYTLFGGFLGATYTDVIQGLIILAGLIVVPVVSIASTGGPVEMVKSVEAASPQFGSMVAGASILAVLGNLALGLGYFGQPHIIVRFMALRSAKDATMGAAVGTAWLVLCMIGAVSTALGGVAYLQQNPTVSLTDPENAESVFLDLAQLLFHPLVAGFLLAAVLAAIMSTISSQLIVTSSALVEDLIGIVGKQSSKNAELWYGRIGVLIVAVIAGLLALQRNDTVFDLVSFAWAGFGSAFGPVVLLTLFWRRLTWPGALAGIISGAATAFVWGKFPTVGTVFGLLDQPLYEMIPGFGASLLLSVLVSFSTRPRSDEALALFDSLKDERAKSAKAITPLKSSQSDAGS